MSLQFTSPTTAFITLADGTQIPLTRFVFDANLATNVLVNPGFESGNTGWVFSPNTLTNDVSLAHAGSRFVGLGGINNANDYFYQDVTIPSDSQRPYIQFWYRIFTEETATSTAYDRMVIRLLNPSNNAALATLAEFSNLNATTGWVQSQQYDLMAYRGQTIRLNFAALTDSSNFTSFRIDDVSLMTGGGTDIPTCTYTYSAFSACQPNGTQTRSVLSSSPAQCTGTPVLSQPCTYTPPTSSNLPYFHGNLSYAGLGSGNVTLGADQIVNGRSSTSGTLRMELWAFSAPYTGGSSGYKSAQTSQLNPLGAKASYTNISQTVSQLTTPPAGTWYLSMLLTEYTGSTNNDGFTVDDYLNFSTPWVVGTSPPSCTSNIGTLNIIADSYAFIFINGALRGQGQAIMQLPAGSYLLSVRDANGRECYSQTVYVTACKVNEYRSNTYCRTF
jgi:hypothetical protein